ncbi:MAG TPA: dihydrolipoamide acetyltransferase family protein, partial [Gammaproteobacteria bacterium]|nr:dihydrolipoamide acetyltransferase family protein [Gammaproteobacteria bacterium]
VPSLEAGVITKILVPAGTTVDVGTVLAVIESGAAAVSGPPAARPAAQAPARLAPATASQFAAAAQHPAPRASNDAGMKARVASAPTELPTQRQGEMRLSPAVRRLAAEYRIDLAAVSGSGRKGRITRRNVIDFIETRKSQSRPAAAAASTPTPAAARAPAAATAARAAAPSPAPAQSTAAPAGKVQPFTRIRRLTAEHMVRSKATSPHVLQAVEVDFFRVDQVRKIVRDAFKAKHGHSLTYLPFIAHAVCQALHDFPNLNSSVQGDGLVRHEHVNLGIAVDLGPEGLVAPVIKHAETLSVVQLATAINDLSARARSGRLKPDDFANGTYTLSNSGTFGTLITAPIINQPQVAILSTDGVRKKPVVIETSDGDAIAIRPVGILAQSFDHRAVDGAYSAAFLDRVRKLLEAGQWPVEV